MNGSSTLSDGRQVMDQVELLEDEADLLAAEDVLLDLVHRGEVSPSIAIVPEVGRSSAPSR